MLARPLSITSVLSSLVLRSLAGSSFPRGERYWREGRVLSCTTTADGIAGVVRGHATYQVQLRERAGRLISLCSCPMGGYGACKHAVALGLAYLAANASEPSEHAQARNSQVDRVHERSRDTTAAAVFDTRAALHAWAEEHHVAHELAMVADVLAGDLAADANAKRSNVRYMLGRWSLRDVGSIDGALRFMGYRELAQSVAEAARRYLERAAADVVTAIAEESRPRKEPAPEFRALSARLVELRSTIRSAACPRSAATRAKGTLDFEANALALRWREPIALALGPYSVTPVVAKLVWAPVPAVSCTCKVERCTHGLALLDAMLDLLSDPAAAQQARDIANELTRPAWQRALTELASRDAPAVRRKSEIELWWQVEHVYTPSLEPLVKKLTKKGKLSAGTRMSVTRLIDEYGDSLSAQDLAIAEQLEAWVPTARSMYCVKAFAALVGHPRVVRKSDRDATIRVERVPLGFEATLASDHVRVQPAIGGDAFDPGQLAELLRLYESGEPLLLLEDDRCLLIDASREARRVWRVLQKHGAEFPPESHDQLLEQLAQLERTLPVVVPPQLLGDRLVEAPTIVLRLRLTTDGALEVEPFVRAAAGTPLFPPGAGPRDVLVVRDGQRGHVRRELAAETELVRERLARLPLGNDAPAAGVMRLEDPDTALGFVAAIAEPPAGVEAEWVDDRRATIHKGSFEALSVKVARLRDWFGVEGGLEIDGGRIELAVLLDAIRHQRRFVRLDDRRWVELSDVLRQRLGAIADRAFMVETPSEPEIDNRSGSRALSRGRTAVELSVGAVPAIRELAIAGAHVETPPTWQLVTERLAQAEKLRPKPPSSLVAKLRPYQVEGHAWLSRVAAWGAGACLADDMGLGKTVQAIAVLLDRARLGPALVLAPTSVTLNWIDELKRFAPTLRPILYSSDRACLNQLRKRDVVVASYGLLVRDAAELAAIPFATLVADEAQALKNGQTRRAKAARVLDAEFRIALSGTPIENHLGELWSLFAVVFPGLLGSWEHFRRRFAVPIERDQDPEARAALSRLIQPFLLRRTKQQVARELPSRTEIDVPIVLSPEETELYDDARLAAVAHLQGLSTSRRSSDEQQRFQVLAALTRLRLLASHPRLYDADSPVASSKMQRLLELLDELRSESHRALVFSQFTSHLALVREELERADYKVMYLDGATPPAQRADAIRRFQGGEADVFLLSLKAGGTGINLTAADYVIHLDPWWNPAVEDQATDRAHRIGQTKPVTVYRLITRGTVEEQILALHGDKRALVSAILDGTDVAARLTTRDLLALLGGGAPTAPAIEPPLAQP